MKARPTGRRRIGIGLVAVIAALLTASCAAGEKAQTANESPAIDGGAATVGAIQLHEVSILAPSGPSYPAGGSAQVALVIVNTGTADDTLVGVSTSAGTASALYAAGTDPTAVLTASGSSPTTPAGSTASTGSPSSSSTPSNSSTPSSSATATPAPGTPAAITSLVVPAGQHVGININTGDPVLVLTGLTGALFPATQVQMTFDFTTAGRITLTVPVQLTSPPSSKVLVPPLTSAGPG